MILCPGCTARRNGLAGPRQRLCADVAIDHGGPVDLDAQGPESRGQAGHPGINLWCHEWHSNSQWVNRGEGDNGRRGQVTRAQRAST